MSTPVNIRLCTVADAHLLAQIGAATFNETFGHLYKAQDLQRFLSESRSEGRYAQLLQDPNVCALIATDAHGAVMGYVLAGSCKLPVKDLEPAAGEIRELYVLATFQGYKIGTQLLKAALEALSQRNRKPLYVGVWSENFGAQRLYQRFGFEKAGEYDFPVGEQIDREWIMTLG